jgi:ATP-dependent Zn protease
VIDPSADDTIPRLEELSGYGPAAVWGLDLARDIADARAGRIGWREIDRGLVLAGLPGVGKTIFAKSLAKSCGVKFLASSFARWERAGDGHSNVVKVMCDHFADARAHAPCIMLLDEIDSIPDRERLEPHARAWWHSIVNAVLEQLDGALGREGVIVIGACNNPARLDAALTRAGRLERLISIPLPSTEDLVKIFRFHLKGDLPEMDLLNLAEGIAGFTGGDVEAAVRSARRAARRAGRAMTDTDLEAAVFRSDPIDDVHLHRIAIHEAGHAIAAVALDDAKRFGIGKDTERRDARLQARPDGGPTVETGIDGASGSDGRALAQIAGDATEPDAVPDTGQDTGQDTSHLPVQFITIKARGSLGGFVRYRMDHSPSVPPRRVVLARVAGSLAGRAAEIVALGEADGGSGGSKNSDLASATLLLGELAARHGLGREGGLHWHSTDDRKAAIPEALRPAIEADLQEQMARVETIMRANRDLLVELAERLMIVKTIDAATFARDFAGRVKCEERNA